MVKSMDKIRLFLKGSFLYWLVALDITLMSNIYSILDSSKDNISKELLRVTTYNVDSDNAKVYVDSVINNDGIDFEQKQYLLKLSQYFDDNEYIDDDIIDKYNDIEVLYIDVNEYPNLRYVNNIIENSIDFEQMTHLLKLANKYGNIKKGNLDNDTKIMGIYIRNYNLIVVFDKGDKSFDLETNQTIGHEFIHPSGYLDIEFLNEGIPSLISAEYFNNGDITSYEMETNFVKILIELIGKDKVLEAYATSNMDIIYSGLEDLGYDRVNAINYIYSIDRLCTMDKDDEAFNDIITLAASYSLYYAKVVNASCFDNTKLYLKNIFKNNNIKNYINVNQKVYRIEY